MSNYFQPIIDNQALVNELVSKGLLPRGTTRFIIDSGRPGEPVRVVWEGFADIDLIRLLLDKLDKTEPT